MRSALSFLTPFGPATAPTPRSLDWFPVVGAVIGLAVGGVWWLAARAWPPLLAGAVAVTVDAGLTGCLHLDGLADAADGLLPPLARERRLEVMADPSVGAFGAVVLCTVLVLRVAALASATAAPLVVGALWCESRAAMAVAARTGRYVRPGGLVSAFVPTSTPGAWRAGAVPGLLGVVLALSLAVAQGSAHVFAALGAGLVGAVAVLVLARHRIGGHTGDVLGAAGVVGETLGLLVLAARW